MFLALVDHRLQHLALGREPEAVIDQLGIARHEAVLQMGRLAVERERFDGAMRSEQDGAARRFIDAARLHADEAVLDEIETADAIVMAQPVEFGQERGGRHGLAVDGDGIALLEADLDHRSPCRARPPARWCADRHRAAVPPTDLPEPFLPTRSAAGWHRPRRAPRRACPWPPGSGASRRSRSGRCGS